MSVTLFLTEFLEVICLRTTKMFQVFLSNTKNSIYEVLLCYLKDLASNNPPGLIRHKIRTNQTISIRQNLLTIKSYLSQNTGNWRFHTENTEKGFLQGWCQKSKRLLSGCPWEALPHEGVLALSIEALKRKNVTSVSCMR